MTNKKLLVTANREFLPILQTVLARDGYKVTFTKYKNGRAWVRFASAEDASMFVLRHTSIESYIARYD